MAKHTTRDKIWNAALTYANEWDETDFAKRRSRYGFSAGELIDMKDLDASHKTVTDTLHTMADMGWFNKVGGNGGSPAEFSR